MTLKQAVFDTVGETYRSALFYNVPGGLRFQLSSGASVLDKLLTALRRATAICNDVFKDEERILVHLQVFKPASFFGLRASLRELRMAGIVIPSVREVWIELSEKDEDIGEGGRWISCAFEAPVDRLQNLLWCAIVGDIGIRPDPSCRVYLINVATGLVCHPYDDRGMDVVGRKKPGLAALYTRHKSALLEHDLAAMRQTFE